MDYLQFQMPGHTLGTYGLDILESKETNKFLVLLIEISENKSVSVTNSVEHLATYVKKECLPKNCKQEDIYWFEHYQNGLWPLSSGYEYVKMSWDREKYADPKWTNYKSSEFDALKDVFIKEGNIDHYLSKNKVSK